MSAIDNRCEDSSTLSTGSRTVIVCCADNDPTRPLTEIVPWALLGAATVPLLTVPPIAVQCTESGATVTGVWLLSMPSATNARWVPGKLLTSPSAAAAPGAGLINNSCSLPSLLLTKTPTPLGSLRSWPSDGTLRTVVVSSPRPARPSWSIRPRRG